MKLKRLNIQSLLTRLCTVGMAILGFGCSSNDEPLCMYGTPTGTFEIKGKVISEDNNSTADAIVKITRPDLNSGVYSLYETKTTGNGEYAVKGKEILLDKAKVVCLPDDPALEPDSVVIDLKYDDTGHDDSFWDNGHADATVDFKLKKKKSGQ